jgi:hypothetical protein
MLSELVGSTALSARTRPEDLSASPVSSPLRPAEMIGGGFLRSPQAPTFSPTAADDRHDGDIQADETGEAHADYDNPPSPRWRGRLGTAVVVLCLAGLGAVGAFAYRAVLAGTGSPTLPPIVKAENGTNRNVPNSGDAQPSCSGQTSIASAGASEEFLHAGQPTIRNRRKRCRSLLTRTPLRPVPSDQLRSPRLRPRRPLLRQGFRRHLRPWRPQLRHRLPRTQREATRSSAAPTGQAAQIPRPRRPSRPVQNRVVQRLRSEISVCRSLPTGMAIRRRRLAPVSLRLLESLRRLLPAGAMRWRWPPNAARPMPRRSFEVSRPSSPTSLAGANQTCAAPTSVLRGSITKPRLAPSCQ